MESIVIKKIILKNISNLVNNFSNEFNIDKKKLIDKIFIDYNFKINNDNIDIFDIYNYIGMDELSLGITKYSNNKIDSILSSSK
tara:strand:- start:590 stop:841 length:252 start_codon:yes stop_codon:yes gene_type:complete